MPEITLTDNALQEATLDELKQFADRVGVGYAGLEEEELKDRLRFEGSFD